jgi:3-hydroxybutyryl-CoA dehydratase
MLTQNSWESIELGQLAQTQWSFQQPDFQEFARLSGDDNPVHLDAAYAATTRFGRPIAHGMLVYAVVARYLQQQFPASEVVSEELSFLQPVYANTELTISQEVTALTKELGQIQVTSVVTNAEGKVACQCVTQLKLLC